MLSSHEQIRVAAEAVVSLRTVGRVYEGGGNANSRERVRQAARKLQLPDPPEPRDQSAQGEGAAA